MCVICGCSGVNEGGKMDSTGGNPSIQSHAHDHPHDHDHDHDHERFLPPELLLLSRININSYRKFSFSRVSNLTLSKYASTLVRTDCTQKS